MRDFAKREDVVVANQVSPTIARGYSERISGRQHIEMSIDASLRHLSMDYGDLYIYHMWDYNTSIYEVMRTLHDIVKSEKARYIGISNCFA